MVTKLDTKANNRLQSAGGLILIEMLIVVGIIGLMAGVAMLSFGAMWGNLQFKRQANKLVNTFQMAYNAATTSDRRYEVDLYLYEQCFIFREFTGYEMLDDILANGDDPARIEKYDFDESSMTLDRVEFDFYTQEDLKNGLDNQNSFRFLAGNSGWQAGGRVVLLDEDGMPWTIVVHRFAKPVELLKGEWDLSSLGMLPKDDKDVPF